MPLGFYLGHLITAAIVLVAVIGAVRWRRLDQGGRWLVAAVAVSAAFVPFSLWLVFAGRSNRLLNEGSMFFETVLLIVALASWQPSPSRRRVVWWIAAVFAGAWVAAQWIQGWGAEFSYLSFPVAGLVKVGAAGYTLLGGVQSTDGRWTDHLWFWATSGIMVIYGTEVILAPLWAQVFGVRNDLALAAFAVNTVGNVSGYLLIARGLWRLQPVPEVS